MTRAELCEMAAHLADGGMSYDDITAELRAHYTGRLEMPTRGWVSSLIRDGRKMNDAPAAPKSNKRTVQPILVSQKAPQNTSAETVNNLFMNDLPGDLDFDDLMEIADALKDALAAHDPVLTHHEMTLGDGGPVGIVFTSCAHLGGRYTAHREVRDMIETALAVPGLYWAPLGDDIEGYLSGFPDKASVHEQPMNIGIQLLMLRAMLNKLSGGGRLLFGTASQHGGKWFEARGGHNPVKDAYRDSGVPWFDGQAYIKLHVGPQVYQLAVAHEFPGHSMYNQLHPHARALRWNYPMADVIVQGDKHTYAVSEVTSYIKEYDAGNRKSPFTWFVQTGTAKTGLDKYTVKRWPHGIMEWPVLLFESETHNIECTRHWRTVRAWLQPLMAVA